MYTVFFIISSLSSLQLIHHAFPLLSERREMQTSGDQIDVFSLFIYRCLSFAFFFSKSSPSSLCVLPHGFPLQQRVALVITSCLKQTDGIRESDGQFSQCLFSLRMCTQLLFACVFCMHTTLLLSISFRLPPHSPSPSLPVSLHLCTADVCLSECVCKI